MGVMKQETGREIQHFAKLVEKQGTCWWGNETAAGQFRLDRRGEAAIRFVGMKRGVRILELGCAAGAFTSRLAKSDASITAIDITASLIELARDRMQASNVQFEVANAYALPFEAGAFDAVVGYSILHHLDVSMALPEARRVLVEDGRVWFSEPNMLNPQVFLERNVGFIGRLMQNSPDETALLSWKAKQVFLECGFRNVVVEPFDFLHPCVPPVLISTATKLGSFFERVPLLKEIAGSLEIRADK